jgi:hypothetical protein
MSLGSFLQIIIGLVFTYLILSLVTSEIQGLFSAQQEFKAKSLKQSILRILGEDTLKFTYDQNNNNKIRFLFDGEIPEEFSLITCVQEGTIKQLSFQSSPASPSGWFYFQDTNEKVAIYVENKVLTNDNQVWLEETTNTLVNDPSLVSVPDQTKPQLGSYKPPGENQTPISVKKQICYKYEQKQGKPIINSITELLYKDSQLRSLNQSDTSITKAFTGWVLKLVGKAPTSLVSPNRKSEGFSAINPPELFGQTVVSVLQENLASDSKFTGKADSLDTVIEKLKTKVNFYSPALPTLIKIAESLKFSSDNLTLEGFQKRLTEIFKASQEQSSEVYAVNAKGLSFVLGFIIAVLANADTFYMIKQLNANTNNVSSNLAKVLETNPDALKQCSPPPASQTIDQCLNGNPELKKIMDLNNLPIGWNLSENSENTKRPEWIALKLLGWLITAIAITMGAPFWYKFLGNLVNFRKG